jgi:serine/threonine-protein kinase
MNTPGKPSGSSDAVVVPDIGGRLGRYKLLQKIASGGMASVWLARAEGAAGFEKLVAVKRIHPHLAEEKNFVEMFLDEARIASRIDHANVCAVFDFGQADNTYYIAMEFLVGEPFSRVARALAKNPKAVADPRRPFYVAKLIADACEGLHAAHELRGRDGELLNVVHRDISPQNLFVTFDGVVKVVDFGIASASDRLHHTQGSEVKGKFSYMAPEQARGAKGAKLDRRADVFALGIVLWEMLTLKRLFRRDTPAETLMALVSDPIPPPSAARPGIPPELDAIVLKSLARSPDERYATARELGRDLNRFLGKAGEVIGPADLEEWIDLLMPGSKEQARQSIEAVLNGDTTAIVEVAAGEFSESDLVAVEDSAVKARRENTGAGRVSMPSDVRAAPRLMGPGTPIPGMSVPPMPPAAPPPAIPPDVTARLGALEAQRAADHTGERKGLPIVPLAVGAVVLVGLIGGGVAFLARGGGEEAAPAAATTTAVAAPRVAGPAEGGGLGGAAAAAGTTPGAAAAGGSPVAVEVATAGTPAGAAPAAGGATVGPGGAAASATGSAAGAPSVVAAVPAGAGDTGSGASHVRTQRGGGSSGRSPRGGGGGGGGGGSSSTGGGGGASAPATGEGGLAVVTPGGWANVYDGAGRYLGQTPLNTTLPAGSHTLQLRPFGQPPAVRVPVTITPGTTARVRHPLEE